MDVVVIPQYPDALAEGRLFQFDGYDPTDAYGADRAGFAAMAAALEDEGHCVHTPDQLDPRKADVVVFIDMNFDVLDELLGLQERPGLVYVMREPPSVRPYNAASRLPAFATLFDTVLSWNPTVVSALPNGKEYDIPQYLEASETATPPFEEQRLLVNISSRKYSNHPQELYSARERVIQYYDQTAPEDFTLYGLYWNRRHRLEDVYHHGKVRSRTYRTYKGLVEDKATAYANHRFALCFENMAGINGYLTEKLFDCLRAGAVPVYWGASNVSEVVPKETFIDYREYGSPEVLNDYLQSMGVAEYREYREAAREFIASLPDRLLPKTYGQTLLSAVHSAAEASDITSPSAILDEVRIRGSLSRLEDRPHSMTRRERLRSLSGLLLRHPKRVLSNPMAAKSCLQSLLPEDLDLDFTDR